VWVGICVFATKLLDGYRAYAAVLSGYTVALIATQQIDAPQHVFEVSMASGAAIAVGILSVAVVNTLMFAPGRQPRLVAQLAAIRRRVREYPTAAFRGEQPSRPPSWRYSGTSWRSRPEIGTVAPESTSGPVRSAAAPERDRRTCG
jgi:uncharacterized membrane protein YccC